MITTRRTRSAAVLLLSLTLLSISGCRHGDGTGKDAANKGGKKGMEDIKKEKTFLSPVSAQRVVRKEIRATVATTGSVVPIRTLMLRSEETGRLRFVKTWREGDVVTSGTLIATIKSDAVESEIATNAAEVEIQKENMAIGQKSVDSAATEYHTLQDLYSRGIAALKDVDSSKLQFDRAMNSQRQNQINLEKGNARLKTAIDRIERLSVRAPFDGILVSRSTLDGQGKLTRSFGSEAITDYDGRLISSEFSICALVDVSKVLVRCDVTSKDIGRVRVGQSATSTIYAREDFDVEGEVVDISNSVDADTRAFRVDVLVVNKDDRLKPGMFGKVDIVTERRRDTIAVPKSVVSHRNNEDVVFIATRPPDSAFDVSQMVNVTKGLEGKDEIEITFGLKANDRLIVRGFEVLQNSTPIGTVDIDAPTSGTP